MTRSRTSTSTSTSWLFELEVAAGAIGFAVLLAPLGFARCARLAEGAARLPALGPATSVQPGRWARRLRPRPSCLARSLATWLALQRRGITSDLKIGARRGDEFAAHAWVEVDGVAVDRVSGDFSPMTEGCAIAEVSGR
ncbi:MAG: lasso peptide biosynthesis B2 protein [Deltaproteobacteria bacterium]|nr:lasso peptide biosynthesis B2 protein [Deltaproteobacteria bacterium]